MFGTKHGIDLDFDVEITRENIVSQEKENIDFQWIKIEDLGKIDLRPAPVKEMIKDAGNNHIVSVSIDRKKN